MDYLNFIKRIYKDFFIQSYEDTCYVFLCGGAGTNCIRDRVRKHLEENHIQVLYPEDLFMEMLYKDKKSDLLQYENLLAESADIIFLICESIGSAAELGAFVQSEEIKNKLLVGIEKKYSRDKSFIMDGPIKRIKNFDPQNVIIYNSKDLSEFYRNMDRYFRGIKQKKKWPMLFYSKKTLDFSSLPEYISFIPLLIYFFQEVNRTDLFKSMKIFLSEKSILPNNYNRLFNASLNYLHKLGIVAMDSSFNLEKDFGEENIKLSTKGYDKVLNFLESSHISNKILLHDKLRCDILKEQLYK